MIRHVTAQPGSFGADSLTIADATSDRSVGNVSAIAVRRLHSTPTVDAENPVMDPLPFMLGAGAVADIEDMVSASMSAATRTAYAKDWARFAEWAAARQATTLPADPWLVAHYLTDAAQILKPDGRPRYAPATLTRWTSSINQIHTAAGHDAPGCTAVVRRTLAGIRTVRATPPVRRAPLLLTDLQNILTNMRAGSTHAVLGAKVLERRDALVLLLGFAGALRRAELAALNLSDVTLHAQDGLRLLLRTSKTDQQARGTTKALPYGASHLTCAPCALLRWRQVLDAFDANGRAAVIKILRTAEPFAQHVCGQAHQAPQMTFSTPSPAGELPLLRVAGRSGNLTDRRLSGEAIHKMIRTRAARAGLPSATVALLGGHSLRAGFVTQGFRSGADAHAIMRQTGHRSPAMLEVYAREDAPLIGNAVTHLGL